jgi:hypothetical protein
MHLLAIKREKSLQSARVFAEGLREEVTSILPLMRSGVFFTFAPPEDHLDQKLCYRKDKKESIKEITI